jgi:aminoglycoside phosphotransferase (APT) family kinase protein
LKVPRYSTVVRATAAAAHGYAVYSYVPGHALTPSALSTSERGAAADAIATFLRSLHGYQPSESTAACLPRVDERLYAIEIRELADRVILPDLSTAQARRLGEWFDWYLDTPGGVSVSPAVIHADLGRDHVLVSEGRVTEVIDFSDVSFGDPDYDFSSLFIDVGEEFTIDAARRYGHPDTQCLLEKLRYFDIVDQVDTIVNGNGQALPGQREQAWDRLRQCLR